MAVFKLKMAFQNRKIFYGLFSQNETQ